MLGAYLYQSAGAGSIPVYSFGNLPSLYHFPFFSFDVSRLEQTVEDQKREILSLRTLTSGGSYSGRTSRSTSPTPPSLQSYDETPHRRRSKVSSKIHTVL